MLPDRPEEEEYQERVFEPFAFGAELPAKPILPPKRRSIKGPRGEKSNFGRYSNNRKETSEGIRYSESKRAPVASNGQLGEGFIFSAGEKNNDFTFN